MRLEQPRFRDACKCECRNDKKSKKIIVGKISLFNNTCAVVRLQ